MVIEYICNCDVFRNMDLNSPCVKAFMDDLFLQSSSIENTEVLLNRCLAALSWARMSFRASKSRSIVITNGKVLNISPYSSNNEIIPSIHSNPVKFLGRTIDVSISDNEAIVSFKEKVSRGLDLIDKSTHRGTHKVWILQNLFIPRIRWPLLIYEISISVALSIEQHISSLLRKWLGLHPSIRIIYLYITLSTTN